MKITRQDINPRTKWEVSPEQANNPFNGMEQEQLLKDVVTGKFYWNQDIGVVRGKCCILTALTPIVKTLDSIGNIAYRIRRLLLCTHFLKEKEGERKYSIIDRSTDVAVDILKIITTPLFLIGMEFAAIYGIFSPRNGAKLYATLERVTYGHANYYLAPCFQPIPQKLVFCPENRSQREGERIQQSLNMESLYFSEEDPIEIPEEIYQQNSLRILKISMKGRTAVPEKLKNLTSLKCLIIYDGELTEVPDWVFQLETLEELNLRNNKLAKLPERLPNLPSLKTLNLSGNRLTELPNWIGELSNLTQLHVESNKLTKLPEGLKNLTSIEILNVYKNELTELPDWIEELTSLKMFEIWENNFNQFPVWLAQFAKNRTVQI